MLRWEIKPELEIFDVGMAHYMNQLLHEKLLQPPLYANILLGNIAGAQATAHHVAAILSSLPDQTFFCFAGIGRYQLQANVLGVAMADGVRVGLEDNLWLDDQRNRATNVGLVKRIADIASLAQRNLATPSSVRNMLNLRQPLCERTLSAKKHTTKEKAHEEPESLRIWSRPQASAR
jgi:3-keto-5-aminohexanoate cleavage enzyme